MNLYFIAYSHGPNLDWFVSAPTAERALALWAESEMVAGFYRPGVDDPPEVFLLPPPGDAEKVHAWFKDIREVRAQAGA